MITVDNTADWEVTGAYITWCGEVDGKYTVEVAWQTAAHGFGSLVLRQAPRSRVPEIDSETLPRSFVSKVLAKLVTDADLRG